MILTLALEELLRVLLPRGTFHIDSIFRIILSYD
jgi:hypothetical protein